MSPLVVRPRDRATLSPLLLPSSSARRFSSSSRPPRARPSNPARRSPVAVGVPPPPPVLQSPPSPDHLYISEKLARVLPPPSPPPPPPINLPRPPHLGLCHSCQLSSMDSDLPHSDIALALGFGPACGEEEDGVGPGPWGVMPINATTFVGLGAKLTANFGTAQLIIYMSYSTCPFPFYILHLFRTPVILALNFFSHNNHHSISLPNPSLLLSLLV
jgi:hypothetical protein